MIVTFEPIVMRQLMKGVCAGCGLKRQRTVKVEHTINPFNKNPDGSVKNREEVRASVQKELNEKIEKMKKEFRCSGCSVYYV